MAKGTKKIKIEKIETVVEEIINIKVQLREKIQEFPMQSGVYLMKNSTSKIIYVGKAKNLRARVKSYFLNSQDLTPKTKLLVHNIRSIEYILTKTEVEAFLLEASLIKKHRPKYNIRLKDDKNYPYIKVSLNDKFPRLYLSRNVKRDGSFYFGPFTKGAAVTHTIRYLNQTFQIRDCSDAELSSRKRPCLNFQMERCSAPCVKFIDSQTYKKDIQLVLKFLKGENKKLLKDLQDKMFQASEDEKYELAARTRDHIKSISAILEKQTVVSANSNSDKDFIFYTGDENGCWIQMLFIRNGRVIGTKGQLLNSINPQDPMEEPKEWFVSFLNQYYEDNIIPDNVNVCVDLGGDIFKLLEAVLNERKNQNIDLKTQVRVEFCKNKEDTTLMEMTEKNALEAFDKYKTQQAGVKVALEEIQKKFHLPTYPHRIECYDISHFQGSNIVASQVVFEDGEPAKQHYRKYQIKTLTDSNDFAALAEVLSRRLNHNEWDKPDLVILDGGKGQLSAVVKIFEEKNITNWPLVAMAKARTESNFENSEVESSQERFFLPHRQNPVLFRSNSKALKILMHIRDEAHRFAITYHREKREASSFSTT